jgi:hypothetical protein
MLSFYRPGGLRRLRHIAFPRVEAWRTRATGRLFFHGCAFKYKRKSRQHGVPMCAKHGESTPLWLVGPLGLLAWQPIMTTLVIGQKVCSRKYRRL